MSENDNVTDNFPVYRILYIDISGKHGKIDPVGTDEIDPVKTA